MVLRLGKITKIAALMKCIFYYDSATYPLQAVTTGLEHKLNMHFLNVEIYTSGTAHV